MSCEYVIYFKRCNRRPSNERSSQSKQHRMPAQADRCGVPSRRTRLFQQREGAFRKADDSPGAFSAPGADGARMRHAPHSWEGYGIVLRFVTDVLAGVPTLEALESCSDIDPLFGTTLQRLAQLVADLFPTDPFEELATFLPRARRDEARRAASHREEGK